MTQVPVAAAESSDTNVDACSVKKVIRTVRVLSAMTQIGRTPDQTESAKAPAKAGALWLRESEGCLLL